MTWRDWLPWPIGTHYCVVDMVLLFIFALALALNGIVILGFGHPRLLAIPCGLVMVGLALGCAYVLATKETTGLR